MAAESKTALEPERERELLELDAKLAGANHYEALGLKPGAQPEAVRQAFRELSRRFHPDRFFGKDLGELRPKVDGIFRRLVEAQQVLTDPERLAAYLLENPALAAAARRAAKPPGAPAEPPAPKSEEELARDGERRARFAKHPYLAKTAHVQGLVVRAKRCLADKDYHQALSLLTNATELDAQHPEARALLMEARKKSDLLRSETEAKRGREALERGDEEGAISAFRAAVLASPANGDAAFRAAQLLERRGEAGLREAVSFANKAVEADPKSVPARVLLAQIYERLGMQALAKKHFEEGERIDPKHPALKKRVKKGWPF